MVRQGGTGLSPIRSGCVDLDAAGIRFKSEK